tara:strand:+ start:327 stop:1019 length:693 start_codon:yes stop_codon:yes gene_type:complete
MTTQTAITLSNRTLDVLKNFSTINSNILVKPGNIINTISPIKNVMAEATIEEDFDTEFGIWDLNKFLGTVSLFNKPEYEFYEKYVKIREANTSTEVIYYYSEPRLLTTVHKKINMPETVVSCTLTQSVFSDILRAASVLQVSDIAIRSNGQDIEIVALDKSDSTTNNYSVTIGDNTTSADFNFCFKAENLKMLPGDYDINISDKIVSEFNRVNDDLTYWVALESDSTYNG